MKISSIYKAFNIRRMIDMHSLSPPGVYFAFIYTRLREGEHISHQANVKSIKYARLLCFRPDIVGESGVSSALNDLP